MTTILKFPDASILASEIVCIYFIICEGGFDIKADTKSGKTVQLNWVYKQAEPRDFINEYTCLWENAIKT
uniref:Uncharacterized protein n=1 Tax=viral metagenome TaxID=1070528 RepID=A0A6C0JR39_9ZZZZ